jgi:hypothetical protein
MSLQRVKVEIVLLKIVKPHVSALGNLYTLRLINYKRISDVSARSGLDLLYISNCPKIRNVSALSM